jgi:cytochrome P450
VETIESSLRSFGLAMMLHPDVQKRAQNEIEQIIGFGRLPTFEDRQSLPYINACVLEVLRWHPSTPLGKHLLHSKKH